MSENQLSLDNHLLIRVEDMETNINDEKLNEYVVLKSHFCGRVLYLCKENLETLELPPTPHGSVYACGNIKLLYDKRKDIPHSIKVIKEFSYNVKGISGLEYVTLGEVSFWAPNFGPLLTLPNQVPINVHNVAVYYRDYLGPAGVGIFALTAPASADY